MSARSAPSSISSVPLVSQPICLNTTSSSLPLTHSYSRCDELRVRIHENHLSYLNRDETPAKLEMRTKIECLIAEYLSLVPNTHKFSFPEVSDCLNRSIIENKEFSAYKACNAFEALEKYATNLITLPWRHEYHSICPYSGFYRHVIDKHIIGAENILFLMGFVDNHSKGIYQLAPPIDPDRVSRVSLECLVAFVELQIMIQIRETLKSKGFSNISWKEIHSVRVEYVCGQSDSIKLICEMKRTAKLIDYENPTASNGPKRLVTGNKDNQLLSNGFSLLDENICTQKQSYRDKQLPHNYIDDFEDNTESFDLMNYPILNSHSFPSTPSCQYCLPQTNSLQLSVCPPPTLTYIRPPLFAPFPTNNQMFIAPKTQSVSKGVQAEIPNVSNGIENSFNKISIQSNNKTLMSDIEGLSAKTKNSQTRRDSSQSINEKSGKRGSFYDNLDPFISLEPSVLTEFKSNSSDRKLFDKKSPTIEKTHNSLEKKKLIDGKSLSKIVNSVKPHSNPLKFANNSNNTSIDSNSREAKQTNLETKNTLISTNSQLSSNSSPIISASNGKTRTDESKCDTTKQLNANKRIKGWSCTTCTYLNSESKDVCEMCHRSRKIGNEATPLISGGRECSRCTLVNDKNEMFCRACDTSLADSPTYI